MLSFTQLVRRLIRQPLISASVILGIAVAIALGIAIPLATDVLAARGLRATLEALPPQSQSIQLVRDAVAFDQPFQDRVRQQLGDLLVDDYTMSYLPLLQARDEATVLERPVRLRTQGNLSEYIEVRQQVQSPDLRRQTQEGSAACGADTPDASSIDVLLSVEQMQLTSWKVGDRLCLGNLFSVTIAGSFVPKNTQEPYWFGDERPFRGEPPSGPGSSDLVIVLMLADDDLNGVDRSWFGGGAATHTYRGFVRSSVITLANIEDVFDRFSRFRTDLVASQPPVLLQTEVDTAITTFRMRFQFLQSALIALLLLLIVLAMIYVLLVAVMTTQQQRNEIALLLSRGASRQQVLVSHLAQALVLAIPGLGFGVVLGTLGIRVLSQTALFQGLSGNAGDPVRLTTTTWLVPLAILLVAVLSFGFALWSTLGHSSVTLRQERARPARSVAWLRPQVDGLLLFFAGLGWWQLRRSGGSLIATPNGEAQFNLLVLLTPTILLISGSLVFLRLFPLIARGLGWYLARRRGLVAALSAWHLARNPQEYGRLALLLTLTIGLGVYSQTATSAIVQSQQRQALDQVGADVRIPLETEDDPEAMLAALPAASHTLLSRIDAQRLVTRGNAEYQQGTLPVLGVEGASLADVLKRSGSDDAPMLAALGGLGTTATAPLGLPLPPDAEAIRVHLRGETPDVTVVVKLAGINGEREIAMGQTTTAWNWLEVAIPSDLQPPYTFQALIVAKPSQQVSTSGQTLIVDGIAARTPRGDVPVDDVARLDAWEALGSRAGETQIRPSRGAAADSAAIEWYVGTLPAGHWAALRFRVPLTIAVDVFQIGDGSQASLDPLLLLRIGDQRLEAQVQQRFERFPGIDAQTGVLADRTQLVKLLTYGRPTAQGPAEIQYNVPPPLSPTELRVALRTGTVAHVEAPGETKAEVLRLLGADPLSNGVQVILRVGFGCTLILSICGFLTYSALTIRARQIEWAILGAVGLSTRQLLVLIAVEQGFVLSGSLLTGTLTGLFLATTTRQFLQVVSSTLSSAPARFDWQGYVPLIVGLCIAFVLTLLLLLVYIQRRGMIRAMRLGEG